ncbi:MAG: YceI family protein [Gammaproteobacteria bacterium]|nr:YceI family protein [Gammaproteobacteria bacterium]
MGMFRTKSLLLLPALLLASLAWAATQWVTQPRQSELTFTARQAGAPFKGSFKRFEADIRFDPTDLANSRFEVRIDLSSVDTRDRERDELIRGPELFAVEKWPTATYVADRFEARGGGKFAAIGKLTLRGVTREVPIEFTFQKDDNGAWLKGTGLVRRLDFGVGQGEWKDTSTVADEVRVEYALLLTRS